WNFWRQAECHSAIGSRDERARSYGPLLRKSLSGESQPTTSRRYAGGEGRKKGRSSRLRRQTMKSPHPCPLPRGSAGEGERYPALLNFGDRWLWLRYL